MRAAAILQSNYRSNRRSDKTRPIELARLLALVNVAMADAAMSIWESKYHYAFWRPITAIRESVPARGRPVPAMGTMPRLAIRVSPHWERRRATWSGRTLLHPSRLILQGMRDSAERSFETIRRFYGTDHIGFTFVSDEFNGVTKDHDGNVRPYMPRSFSTLSQAEEENGQSRIYLGIHWHFDKTAGIAQGEKVADYVFNHAFRPVEGK